MTLIAQRQELKKQKDLYYKELISERKDALSEIAQIKSECAKLRAAVVEAQAAHTARKAELESAKHRYMEVLTALSEFDALPLESFEAAPDEENK